MHPNTNPAAQSLEDDILNGGSDEADLDGLGLNRGDPMGVWGLGFRVWGLGFRVWDLGFRFQGSGFRVQG